MYGIVALADVSFAEPVPSGGEDPVAVARADVCAVPLVGDDTIGDVAGAWQATKERSAIRVIEVCIFLDEIGSFKSGFICAPEP